MSISSKTVDCWQKRIAMTESMTLTELPFIDLRAQRRRIEAEINTAVARVIEHGQYIMGPEVEQLENRLSEFVGAAHCLSCSSGSDALLMALMAYDVKPGDAIITTPFTFFATAEMISLLGATPIFVDIDPETYNLDPVKLKWAVDVSNRDASLNLRGIVTVDLFGLPCDYDEIMAIAHEHDLFVIQDAAQSFGATYKSARVPTQGDIGTTSFFPAKPLGCYGDGGAVFTNDAKLAEKMASIRVHGKGTDKYSNVRIGLNARMDTIQAAILLEKIKIYADEISRRQIVADTYVDHLADTNLQLPIVPEERRSVWAQFTLQSGKRQEIQTALKSEGIPTAVYYIKPLHLLAAYDSLGYQRGDLPVAEAASERVVSLPFHPYLASEQIKRICTAVRAAAKN
jgi:UDP-2-acetamido-2-deoxy-ribo-hexuluronate aminotransferase